MVLEVFAEIIMATAKAVYCSLSPKSIMLLSSPG